MRSSIKGVAPEWYTLLSEEGEDDPVQFYLKPLDGIAWTSVLMESYSTETGEVGGAGVIKAFKLGVKNWKNIEDGDNPGTELKFAAQVIGRIQPGWIMEVGNRVMEISRLAAGTAKNSDSPSLSPKT